MSSLHSGGRGGFASSVVMQVRKMNQENIQAFLFACALIEIDRQSTIYRAAEDNPKNFPCPMCPDSLFRCGVVSRRIKFVGAHCIKVSPGNQI